MTPRTPDHMRGGILVRAWTEAEDARLVEWLATGHSMAMVARALGRSENSVLQRRARLRDRIEAAQAEAPMVIAHWPRPKAAPAPDVARAEGAQRRRIGGRLAALPRGKFWTVARDLALAQAMAGGAKAADLARDWRCEASDVQARWLALCPDRSQAGAVAALIAVLSDEVAHA